MTPPAGWLDLPPDTGFGLENLPLGVFSGTADDRRRVGVAVGDHVLDVSALDVPGRAELGTGSLNAFLAVGRPTWDALRDRVLDLLTDPVHRAVVEPHLHPRAGVTLHLPIEVADYVDFYSSQHHAENLGRILRPGAPALTPNWRHQPIGYHGRAGTVAVSGTPVVRPHGQRRVAGAAGDDAPTFGPSERLDLEAEVGFVVGVPSEPGRPVAASDFAEHVFGVCLVNDWSARDLQAWETVPLGPFTGKSFLTSMSPWVVPLTALEGARVDPPERDTELLPYLRDDGLRWGLDLTLEVRLNGEPVSHPPFAAMYWTPPQQLAHLTANGAALRTGDLFASGTVSGPEPGQLGSLIELSANGAEPLTLADGSRRTFLEDGDEIVLSATAPAPDGTRIALGEVRGRVVGVTPERAG
ncbi:fumarylacetoacetase [Jatrophihabitans endophyticus]|uniref:fumarylacetoacetase n=1 Tax=Jatrophihabitans endophyticus TaxID=1206085 RepID=UPI0019F903A3|nr:fumarylacetoacetase [Jatrophihabitans endophyticus]MBE7190211.1 fumarylacetoacetase [Jatrophihabitans endophyticus]